MEKKKENNFLMFVAKHQKNDLGKKGEEIAAKYLKENGFKILERNYRDKFDEIDIIAREKSGALVFVEVKTVTNSEKQNIKEFSAEDNFTDFKSKKISRISEMFVAKHQKMIFDIGWRMDLIAITIYENKKVIVRQYKNVG